LGGGHVEQNFTIIRKENRELCAIVKKSGGCNSEAKFTARRKLFDYEVKKNVQLSL
jgi:hypothetical protein